jgi:hypothetical protein
MLRLLLLDYVNRNRWGLAFIALLLFGEALLNMWLGSLVYLLLGPAILA